jgi:uncharacterized protein YegL
MVADQKIQVLNNAIRETIPHMRLAAERNPNARVLIRAIRFATGASWHIHNPIPVETFKWVDLQAEGMIEMGKAMFLLAEALDFTMMPERSLSPVLVLLSNGKPVDDFNRGLTALMEKPWARKAIRIAIAISRDADYQTLQSFIGNPDLRPLLANNPEALVHHIKWASTAVLTAISSPKTTELFQRKTQTISKLNHEGIPRLEVEGLNLEEYIKQRGNHYEGLVRCSQATQQFVSTRFNLDPVFTEVGKELQIISHSLQNRKLIIDIYGNIDQVSQGLYNFLGTHKDLSHLYHIKVSQLNLSQQQITQTRLSPTLILQADSANRQHQVYYELSRQQDTWIGRDQQYLQQICKQQNAKLIVLPTYSKVSSVHARVQTIAGQVNGFPDWQICDLNSRNGTYVNGERVSGCRTLKHGDRITLAYPSVSAQGPGFIFNQSIDRVPSQKLVQPFDCDLICLVINPMQWLTEAARELIDRASQSIIVGLIIISDISTISNDVVPQVKANLVNISNWIKQQYPKLSYEFHQLALYPFYSGLTNVAIDPITQQSLDKFCEPLAYMGKNKALDILTYRLSFKLRSQIQCLEQFIRDQEAILNRDLRQTEKKLRSKSVEDYQNQIRQAFRQVSEAREDFFHSARVELGRSIREQSTSFVANSLLLKITDFIAALNHVVVRKDNQVYIQLQVPDASDTHSAILRFCKSEILKWANAEWERIYYSYGEGGLKELQQKSYNSINKMPYLTLPFPFNQSIPRIRFWEGIENSFVEMKNNTSYFEGNSGIQGDMVRLGFQAAIAAGLVAVSPIAAIIQGSNLLLNINSLVGSTLNRSKIEALKLEQAVEGLRQNACNNYQNIARYLLDRVSQNVNLALDKEERKFRKALEVLDEQCVEHIQLIIASIDNYKVRQQSLLQNKVFVDQLKNLLN